MVDSDLRALKVVVAVRFVFISCYGPHLYSGFPDTIRENILIPLKVFQI